MVDDIMAEASRQQYEYMAPESCSSIIDVFAEATNVLHAVTKATKWLRR